MTKHLMAQVVVQGPGERALEWDDHLIMTTPRRPLRRRERRTNLRLRELVDEIKAEIYKNRGDLNLQFTRLAQLQAEVDALKKSARN